MQQVNVARSILVTMALGATLAGAQGKPDKAFWLGQYRKIEQWMDTQNVKAFEATLDKNFYLVDNHGKRMSRADFVKKELGAFEQAITSNNDVRVTAITQSGKQVNVSYDWHYRLGMNGPNKPITIAGREVGTDTWEKKGGRWMTVKTTVKLATSRELAGKA